MKLIRMKLICPYLAFSAIFVVAVAHAADPVNGERLAKTSCAGCHIVVSATSSRDVADAPPFAVIARKAGFNAEMLAFLILDPHPKMNFAVSPRDATDIAVYMSTLSR